MQKKRNIRLSLSLVMLLIITIAVYWYRNDSRSFSMDTNLFRVNDFKAVNRIVLESSTAKVDLNFNGAKWKVNNQYDADRNMIDVLFATLQQAEPKRPVASSQADSIGRWLEQNGIKVSLYIGEQVEKLFYAGGNDSKTLAYFKIPQGEPYVMVIPGYRVYTSGIFELTEGGWKDKYVFGFNWRNFMELEASFPGRPKDGFKVSMSEDYFGIEGIAEADTANLNTFLDQVSLLTVDQYIENNVLADSLNKIQPQVIIQVRDIAKREYTLRIFSIREKDGQFIGLIGDSQPALFDPRKIIQVVKPRDFFVPK